MGPPHREGEGRKQERREQERRGEERRGKERKGEERIGQGMSCHEALQSIIGGLNLNWIAVSMRACQHQVPTECHPHPTASAHTHTHTHILFDSSHFALTHTTWPVASKHSGAPLSFSLFLRMRQIYSSSGSFSLTHDEDLSALNLRLIGARSHAEHT